MLCKRCRSTNSEVSNTRYKAETNTITRYRKCLDCGHHWKTIESMQKPGALHQCAYELERLIDRFPFCDRGHPLPIEYWGKDCPICEDLRILNKCVKNLDAVFDDGPHVPVPPSPAGRKP